MKNKNIIGGIGFILIALALLLGDINLFPNLKLNLWELLASLLLVMGLLAREYWVGISGLAWLGYLIQKDYHFYEITPTTIFVVIMLLGIGFSMIFRNTESSFKFSKEKVKMSHHGRSEDYANLFSSTTHYLDDQINDLDIANFFGTSKYYFDTQTRDQAITVDCVNLFGTTLFYVPENWNIRGNMISIFGSDNVIANEPATKNGPILQINGANFFGSVRVILLTEH
ncbi:LiaF transmembrane domain-containing protein [Ligilactobacillus equi]|uniref:LiaF transmembrane domain-containing protein n=2 Tax=Ligilactobacillus equi TaxID=137357 RepID=V7HW69_9LACO|nr:heparan-alpha-glucosaminide N-acetyltransferase domain-containing protein [Ligilactobacillus equi]ETA73438.1 hypothetical protein LEQ_0159c [Ligilactobacillus equi DPC 6820]KRL80209.1 hypothetical protein FC36_GL000043 [Ligilactobacillus equi DSM 15833 = JCM 10991]MCQ2556994.1 heparan-alpha-glucosaminide N-acetyltransferase domain-containing protein [Ligilactobacillus sp.]